MEDPERVRKRKLVEDVDTETPSDTENEEVAVNEDETDKKKRKLPKGEVSPEKAITNRWLIHPGNLAGDTWHIAAAMLLDSTIKLIIVTHLDISRAWNKSIDEVEDIETGIRNFITLAREMTIRAQADFKKENNERIPKARTISPKKMKERYMINWQQMGALAELLLESGLTDTKAVYVIAGLEAWDKSTNPWPYAREAVEKNETLYQLFEPGDFVGMTKASTSTIAKSLYYNKNQTIALLQQRLAATNNDVVREAIIKQRDELFSMPINIPELKDAKVILVMLRDAEENKQHNTTQEKIEQILNTVSKVSQDEKNPQKYKVLLIAQGKTTIPTTGKNKEKLDNLYQGAWKSYKESGVLIGHFNMYDFLEQYDKRKYPVLTTRSLITLFWREFVNHNLFGGLIGGRSGSLDIAAFMGATNVLCFDELKFNKGFVDLEVTPDNVRLFMTYPIMDIVLLDNGKLKETDLINFLNHTPTDLNNLRTLTETAEGYAAVYQRKEDKKETKDSKAKASVNLSAVSTMGKVTDNRRGSALLLYSIDDAANFPTLKTLFNREKYDALQNVTTSASTNHDLDTNSTTRTEISSSRLARWQSNSSDKWEQYAAQHHDLEIPLTEDKVSEKSVEAVDTSTQSMDETDKSISTSFPPSRGFTRTND